MSKSKGNVVNPDEAVEKYGADSLRLYEMFMGPLTDMKPWNTKGIIGVHRFLDAFWHYIRAWRKDYFKAVTGKDRARLKFYAQSHCGHKAADVIIEKTVKKVTDDIESYKFNTAISQLMICLNALRKPDAPGLTRKQIDRLLIILSPFAPHLCEELWRQVGHQGSIFRRSWTGYNRFMAKDEQVELVVQVNGKRRASVKVEPGLIEPEAVELAKADLSVKKWIDGKTIVKVVYVQDKLVNIVVNG
jgi:leucyl-tRNA synthetase